MNTYTTDSKVEEIPEWKKKLQSFDAQASYGSSLAERAERLATQTQVNGKADGETSPLHSANPKSENQIPMDKFLYTEALMRKAEREGKIYTQRLLQRQIEKAMQNSRSADTEASTPMPTIYADYLRKHNMQDNYEEGILDDSSKNANIFFENGLKSSIIDIAELTPCLRRMVDDKIVDTVVCEVSPTYDAFFDWEFDWTVPKKNGFTVRAIKAVGDNRIQGMVALKADDRNQAVLIDIIESAPFNNPHNPRFIEKEYLGVGGHLFAEAVRESYECGYDGYVYFKAKSGLIDYYHKAFGAVLINPRERIMAIEEGSAKKLYDKYYMGR